ncbi:MAG: response regulator [Candidatus Riflemargulisbacteria bacterium]
MNVLLVDDHPMTVDGYVLALSKRTAKFSIPVFDSAFTCEQAYHLIEKAKYGYDIAIIDLDVPECIAPPIASGKELSLVLSTKMPQTKIIIITAHTELITVYDIWKCLRPDGLVIKNDLTPIGLLKIVEEVIGGESYKSPTVEKCIREIWKKELIVEDYNRQIIQYLALGIRIKDLHEVISLSQGAIQKRIVKINSVFEVTDKEGLLREVKRLGFI